MFLYTIVGVFGVLQATGAASKSANTLLTILAPAPYVDILAALSPSFERAHSVRLHLMSVETKEQVNTILTQTPESYSLDIALLSTQDAPGLFKQQTLQAWPSASQLPLHIIPFVVEASQGSSTSPYQQALGWVLAQQSTHVAQAKLFIHWLNQADTQSQLAANHPELTLWREQAVPSSSPSLSATPPQTSLAPVAKRSTLAPLAWRLYVGETLQQGLQRWAKQANLVLVWDIPMDFPISARLSAHGPLQEALQQVFAAYAKADPAIYLESSIEADIPTAHEFSARRQALSNRSLRGVNEDCEGRRQQRRKFVCEGYKTLHIRIKDKHG